MEATKMQMRLPDRWFLIFMISLSALISGSAGKDSLMDECADDLNKVTACLSFATGKAAKPTKDCCSAVTEIREDKPVCLCYFIQQTHNGSAQAKSLGIQEAKLLQLPSACQLANVTVSDCPNINGGSWCSSCLPANHRIRNLTELLNIPPSSPYYSIFNATASTAPSASTSTGTSSPTTTDGGSNADKQAPSLAGILAIAVVIFFHALPAGPASAGEGFFFG